MVKVKIPDMMCAHCEKRIRDAVTNAGGKIISLDLASKIVEADFAQGADKLLSVLDEAGYDAQVL